MGLLVKFAHNGYLIRHLPIETLRWLGTADLLYLTAT